MRLDNHGPLHFLHRLHIGVLVIFIALMAFGWYAITYLLADTGVPGEVPQETLNLIYGLGCAILGLAGWAVIWRKEVFVVDLGRTIKGRWAVFWGMAAVVIFWGTALWFLAQVS